ncbi:hypothetical protein [Streptomyces sp. NPDC046862]|uniref:hypothetical protein n=1 Tax=Streptomyces sp. NPDC046862 TaxID=3154603 RepID=UPI003454333C
MNAASNGGAQLQRRSDAQSPPEVVFEALLVDAGAEQLGQDTGLGVAIPDLRTEFGPLKYGGPSP